MSLDRSDILSFLFEMEMPRVGYGISKKDPGHALSKAIRLLSSNGLPLHKARNVICLFRILPNTYIEEINDALDLLEEKMHREADLLWTTAFSKTSDKTGEIKVLLMAGNFL